MKFNEFGTTGLKVSEIGFGGSRIGGFFADTNSNREAVNVLHQALGSGITFYDTADMYAQGESESLIGSAFRGRRGQVILATKGGYCLPAQRNFLKRVKPLVRPLVKLLGLKRNRLRASVSGALSQDFSPAYLTNALNASLKRLQTDYVDLYQLHSPGPSFLKSAAFGGALETLENLKRHGKLRFYGVATEVPQDASFCLSAAGISSLQLGFGLLDLDALDAGTLTAASERGLGIIARGCFGGGLLKEGRDAAELRQVTDKWPRIEALRAMSRRMQRPLLDIALQFCRGTPGISVTLLGMRLESQLHDNLRYVQSSPFSAEEYSSVRRLEQSAS